MPVVVWRVLPFVLVLVLGAGAAYKITADHYRAIIAARDLKAATELAAAQQRVIEAVQEQQVITTQTASDYEKTIAEIRAKYAADFDSYVAASADSVRVDKSNDADRLRTVPRTASKPDAAAACYRLSTELRLAAELQTQQLISLQDWIRKQKAASK